MSLEKALYLMPTRAISGISATSPKESAESVTFMHWLLLNRYVCQSCIPSGDFSENSDSEKYESSV